MELTDILLALLVAMVTASWGTTQARFSRMDARMDRLESRLGRIEQDLATKPSRTEFDAFKAEIRAEIMTVRTDLTQIALAVGAGRRPQASEG